MRGLSTALGGNFSDRSGELSIMSFHDINGPADSARWRWKRPAESGRTMRGDGSVSWSIRRVAAIPWSREPGPARVGRCSSPTMSGTVALSANLPGTVGVRTSAVGERGCWGEASPSHPIHPAPRFGIRRVPVPAEVILIAVCWYLRYGLSYRDLEDLL